MVVFEIVRKTRTTPQSCERSLGRWLGFRSAAKTQTLPLKNLSKTSECWSAWEMGSVFEIVRKTRATPQSSVCADIQNHDTTQVECEHPMVVIKHVMRMEVAMKE
jgi:hypothetical protein